MVTTNVTEKNWKYYYQLGRNLYDQDKWDEAIAAFTECLSLKPNDIDALYMRGRSHISLQHYYEGQADLDNLIQVYPNSYYSHYLHGIGLYTMQKYHESLAAFNKCLEFNPDYESAFTYQGLSYVKLNQYDEARQAFKKAIEFKHSQNAYYHYGFALYAMKQYEEAIHALDKSLELDPNYFYAYFYKGCTLFALERKEAAERYFKQCIEVAPDNYIAWNRYAIGLSLLNKHRECISSCEEALKRCPGHLSTIALQQRSITCLNSQNNNIKNEPLEDKTMLERQQEEMDILQKQVALLLNKIDDMSNKIKTEQQFLDELLRNAAKDGNLKKMDLALQMGANLEATDPSGLTPLFLSILNGHYDIAEFLLNNKANLESRNKQDETILHVMSKQGNIDAVKFIIKNIPKNNSEATLLLSVHELINQLETNDIVHLTEIKQLLADTILFQASKQGNTHLAKIALEKGANKNAKDGYLETALHKACYSGQIDTVKFLLEMGCSITERDRNQQTPSEVTSHNDVKELISNYQRKHATIIQASVRRFFERKKYDTAKEHYKKEVKEKSVNIFTTLANNEEFEKITELANSIRENRLHDAMQIIRGISKQEMQTKLGFKVKY